jgi:creatinine amidohydrolase/Fe(II)-dependent formamide hydrolase-like protein
MYTCLPTPKLNTRSRVIALLPIGSCEQHGPHLPVDTDLRIAQLIAHELVKVFPSEKAILLPSIPFSCSWEHQGSGTIALRTSTVSSLIHDIAFSLKKWATPVFLVLLNWHGGNSALASIATEVTAREGIPTTVIQALTLANQAWNSENKLPFSDAHAGTLETSIVQAYWPELVDTTDLDKIDFVPQVEPATAQSVFQALGIYAVSKTGIWGKPQQADSQRGKKLIGDIVKEIYEQITKLLELVESANREERI